MKRSWWGGGIAAVLLSLLPLGGHQGSVAGELSDPLGAAPDDSYDALWSRLSEDVACIGSVDEEPDDVVAAAEVPDASLGVPATIAGLRRVPQETLQEGTTRAFITGYMFPVPSHLAKGIRTTDRAVVAQAGLSAVDEPYVSVAVSVGDPSVLCYALAHAALQPLGGTVSAPPADTDGPVPFADWLPPIPARGARPAGEATEVRGQGAYFLPRHNGPGGAVSMLVWLEEDTTLVEVHGEGVPDPTLRAVAEALVVEPRPAAGQ